jgi:hypothetical protein
MGTAWDTWACCSRPETSRLRCSPNFRSRTGLSVRLQCGSCRRQVPQERGPHIAQSTIWDCMRPATPAPPRNPLAPCDKPPRSYPPLRRRLPRPTSLPMSLRPRLPHPFQRHLPSNGQQYRRLPRRLPANLRRSCLRCRPRQRHRPTCLLPGVRRRDRKSRRKQRLHLHHRFRLCHLHRRFRWCHRYPNRICPSCLPHPRPLRWHPYRPLLPDWLQPNCLQTCQPDLRPRRWQVDARRLSRKVRRPNQTPRP